MCDHLEEAADRDRPTAPRTLGCEECLRTGESWVHLRLCLECGHVGCCDDSPNRHASGHHRATGHPVIKSFEPGEAWAWCFEDEQLADGFDRFPVESPDRHYGPHGAGEARHR
jgi:uncharacterized UBP type Zn finger protein